MDDEALLKQRLLAIAAVRLAGLLIFFLGLAIFYTDLLRPGGWPQVGAIVVIVGVIDAAFGPRLLKRQWDRDRQ